MSLYFTTPIARKALWGGKTLRHYFHYPEDFGDDIGQSWAFSAQEQEGGANVLTGGGFDGRTLKELWDEKPELFKSRYNKFPFIISLVAPEDDLSIQVHPDDEYARTIGFPCGKNEAWVFLQAAPDSAIVYGHNAKDKEDLQSYIDANRWNRLVRHLPVKRGDTVYIPAGVLHALCKYTIVYEIQQSTDITYRFYDYDRTDAKGNKRPLQLQEAVDCLHYGCTHGVARPEPKVIQHPGLVETVCVSNESFVVRRLECQGNCTIAFPGYLLATVVEGRGQVDGIEVGVGDSFLIPASEQVSVDGVLTLMTTAEE